METLLWEIENLKKEKNAVVLAHYYVDEEVQKAADYVGDSYYLAKKAKSCDADTIVFCGVAFMGESAKILNPAKTVLMPDAAADCPMAHMVTKEKILEMREKYDDLAVVCYINSTAETKCLSDVMTRVPRRPSCSGSTGRTRWCPSIRRRGLSRWRSPTTTPCWHMCSRRPPTAFASSERPLGENRLQGVTHEIYH